MRQRSVKMRPAIGKPTFIEVPPNAAKTMSALREMGYDSFASVMDLIDNSVDAGATSIDVTIREAGKGSLVIDILDDGKGMSEDTLAEALKLGSDTKHKASDLGKFGMGLVTASISLAKSVMVLTREKGKTAFEAHFDLDAIERENRFVITLKPAESRRVIHDLGDQGTLVRLSQIDRISDTNVSRFAANLRTKLGQVYRHFLADGLKLRVNTRAVQKYDPLMLDHPQTQVVLDQKIDLGDGTSAKLTVVELPDLGTAGDAEAGIFPHNSGFYVVRNRREIIAGDTFGFYRHHHSYSHFRAEIAYTGKSTVFHEDIKKSSIHPDERLRHKLQALTEKLIVASGRRGKERSEQMPLNVTSKTAEEAINTAFAPAAPSDNGKADAKESKKAEEPKPVPVKFAEVAADAKGRYFHAEQKDGTLMIYYNSKHPLLLMLAETKQKQSATLLGMVTFALARAEQEAKGDAGKLLEKAGDYLATLATPQK